MTKPLADWRGVFTPRETRDDIRCSFFYTLLLPLLWRPLSRPLADSSPSRGAKNPRPWVYDPRAGIFYTSLFPELAEQHDNTGCRKRDDEIQHRSDSALCKHELPRLDVRKSSAPAFLSPYPFLLHVTAALYRTSPSCRDSSDRASLSAESPAFRTAPPPQ